MYIVCCRVTYSMLFGVPQGSVLGLILFFTVYSRPTRSSWDAWVAITSLRLRHADIWLLSPRRYSTASELILTSSINADTWSAFIDDVRLWMQLNVAKMDVLWCASSRQQHLNPDYPLRASSDLVQPVLSVEIGFSAWLRPVDAQHITRNAILSCTCNQCISLEVESLQCP